MRYLIVFERTTTGYSAYSPDLPGCIATGKTRTDAEANIREAGEFHLDGLKLEGEAIPEPSTETTYIEVGAGRPCDV